MADGKVTIDTSIDNSGFEKGTEDLRKSAKSQAAKLAAEYRKQGYSASEAWKKAWEEIPRETKKGTEKAGKYIKENIGGAVDQSTSKIGGLKSSLSGLVKAAGAALVSYGLFEFGKQAIELGSNVAEVQNVVDTAFGDMAYKAEEFANSAIENFGMSELAAKKTSSTYMTMARGMGVAMDAASDMSIELTALSGDVASFFNKSQEEAAYKLQSVFTGEVEPLRELGIVMTQANLQQYAMEKGMNSNIQTMSQAEQVALRYAYVTDKLALASGDFAKTLPTWANQTRVLSMQWQQFMAVIGDSLIQVLSPVLQFLNQFVAQLVEWATTLNAIITSIFGSNTGSTGAAQNAMASAATSAGSLADSTYDAASAQGDLASSTASANQELKNQIKNFSGLDEINTFSVSSASSGTGSTGGALSGITQLPELDTSNYDEAAKEIDSAFTETWKNISKGFEDLFLKPIKNNLYKFDAPIENFKNLFTDIGEKFSEWTTPVSEWFEDYFPQNVESAVSAFTTHWSNIAKLGSQVGRTVWDSISPILDSIVYDGLPMFSEAFDESMSTFETWSDSLTDVFSMIWEGAFDPAFSFVSDVINDLFQSIKNLWDKYGATTFENIRKSIESTKGIFESVWNSYIKPIFDNLFKLLKDTWDNHLQPLISQIGEFVSKLVNFAMDIYNGFIAPIVSWFINTLYPYIAIAINTVVNVIGDFYRGVVDFFKGIIKAGSGLIDFFSGVFSGDWKKAWNGIKDIFTGIFEGFNSLLKNLFANPIISILNGVINVINQAISGLNSISIDIPSWVPWIGGGHFGLNIPSIPNIPYLAQGAVLPANKPFLAMVGDQKNGTNVEAPLDTIKQALREAMAESGTSGNNVYPVNVQVGRKTFLQFVIDEAKMEQTRTGRNPFDLA